jgi:hypothetical protein
MRWLSARVNETAGTPLTAACLLVLVAACAGRPPATAREAFDACMGTSRGTPCPIPMQEGNHTEVSECTKEGDGSLLCYSPNLPVDGGKLGAIEEGNH